MNSWISCSQSFEWLSAYVDQELDDNEVVLARAHLAGCAACRGRLEAIARLGEEIRRGTPVAVSPGLVAGTIERAHALRASSWLPRLRRLAANPEPVLSGMAGVAATATLIAMLLIALALPPGRPAVPAAVMRVWLQQPVGSDANPLLVGHVIEPPRARLQDGSVSPALLAGGDALYTLSAVVTREGRVARLDVLRGSGDRRLLGPLLDAAVATRFEPVRYRGNPVAVNVVWLLAHTSVRPKVG